MNMALGVSLAAHPVGSWNLQRPLSSSQARLSVQRSRLAARCSGNDLSSTSSASLHTPQVPWQQDFPSLVRQNVTGVLSFLEEQVKEFQKIEWPTLESTVKTSLFVIVLSFLLIVALTMVDSCYSFMLAKIMGS